VRGPWNCSHRHGPPISTPVTPFNDRLLFPDESTFQRIEMNHSDHDNAEAAKRAMEYLEASMYKDRMPQRGPLTIPQLG